MVAYFGCHLVMSLCLCRDCESSNGREKDVLQDPGINTCGNSLNNTGYACAMKNLVTTWREQWSVVPGTTPAILPFGIVSLAAGGSEGHPGSMPVFRHAQTASYGFLPGPTGSGMENTFTAQAYDAGDPNYRAQGARAGGRTWSEIDSPFQATYDAPFLGRQGYSGQGLQYFTKQYVTLMTLPFHIFFYKKTRGTLMVEPRTSVPESAALYQCPLGSVSKLPHLC